ncbi:tRNA lysidine(34) synthetase TilS [Psychrobacter sp. CAL346-MNA-CIBAN-0220]|uniref:tRNA lysidine(34) synthetase TilS n=1 Tax=Psychrobacter sp. CAL346-MNA-CIBAN-0220 TaxID=3140457 RepID=UPI003317B1EE
MASSDKNKSNHSKTDSSANSSAIRHYPIGPIALESSIDKQLADAFLASMAEYRDQLCGRRIWLACSGGRDSLALATLCLQLYQQGKLPFLPQLLHVDHGLQADSRRWAMHVAQWAQMQQIPCNVLQAKVFGHDEQAARQARYQVMLSHINQEDVLILAHHADDQAETVLMRLIQGAGANGLSGMQPWRVQTQDARRNILWRPWLTIRRKTISAYAQRLQLPYIDDPTNDSGDNVRSGLRREVLPALAVYNANVIDNIARSAQLLADAQATVSAQAAQDLQQIAINPLSHLPAQRVLNIDNLHTLPLYRQRQLLHYWLSQDEPLPTSKQLTDDVLRLTERQDSNHQTHLDWQGRSQQYRIRRYRQQLYRLSHSWLNWLALPVIEQTLSLFINDVPNSQLPQATLITLRSDNNVTWQLEFAPNALVSLFNHSNLLSAPNTLWSDSNNLSLSHLVSNKNKITLRMAPLGRQQRLQTALATRPQAGKKLTQTLGVPVWLRDSLMVVSAISSGNEVPLLLVSPFDSWVLGIDKSVATMTADYEVLNSAISSILQIRD